MSNYCTLKDIHKSLQPFNTALPNEIYRARDKAENYIRMMLAGKYNTMLFDSTILEIKTLCVEIAVYFIEVDKLSQNGNKAAQITEDETVTSRLTLANKQLKNLKDSGELCKNVVSTAQSLDTNYMYRFTGRPRNILITTGTTTLTTYYVDEHYTIDYKAQTLIRINTDMPATDLNISYQIPLRAMGM